MPHFIFRNVEQSTIQSLSHTLLNDLIEAIGCPPEAITFSVLDASTFQAGIDITASSIFIEVVWLERPYDKKEKVVQLLNQAFPLRDCFVYFRDLKQQEYSKNNVFF